MSELTVDVVFSNNTWSDYPDFCTVVVEKLDPYVKIAKKIIGQFPEGVKGFVNILVSKSIATFMSESTEDGEPYEIEVESLYVVMDDEGNYFLKGYTNSDATDYFETEPI
jgi:hypothetical protein